MPGTITFAHDKLGVIRRVIATCTADAADGTFPNTDIRRIDGHLLALQTNPGATAPTDNYDITLIDEDGLDRLGGVGANRDATTSERVAVGGAPACSPGEVLSLRLANNSVNSAIVVVTLIYAVTGGSEAGTSGSPSVVDTELPAAVELSDALPNGTDPRVGADLLGFDGTVVRRVRVNGSGVIQAQIRDAGSATVTAGNVNTDAADHSGVALRVAAVNVLNNGTNSDRQRNNEPATLLASAARTATTNSPDQTNYNGRGVHVSLDVTVEGPADLSIKIQGKHSVGGTYYDIVDFGVVYTAATDAPGAKTVSLYPGIITADHVGVGAGVNGTIGKSAVLPRVWRAVVTHADATTCTYSLSAVTIL